MYNKKNIYIKYKIYVYGKNRKNNILKLKLLVVKY